MVEGFDLSELLSLTDAAMKDMVKVKTIRPTDSFVSFTALSHEPLDPWLETYRHLFNRVPFYPNNLLIYIIHGHGSYDRCARPHFCHVYGYWPQECHPLIFRKLFEKKWKEIYNGRTQ